MEMQNKTNAGYNNPYINLAINLNDNKSTNNKTLIIICFLILHLINLQICFLGLRYFPYLWSIMHYTLIVVWRIIQIVKYIFGISCLKIFPRVIIHILRVYINIKISVRPLHFMDQTYSVTKLMNYCR